jgi:biuret amidohydrolase
MELRAANTAIVAVHMQNDVVGAGGAFGAFFAEQAEARDVVAKIGTLFAAARDAGATVVYTRVAWNAGYDDLVANSPLLGMVIQAGCLSDGSRGAAIVDDLSPKTGDLVVTHKRVGGFAASQLDVMLRSRGITTVVFTGVATNASVEGTAREASDLGYRTVIVEDACSAANEAAHAASIDSMGLLAEIASSAEVLSALAAGAEVSA